MWQLARDYHGEDHDLSHECDQRTADGAAVSAGLFAARVGLPPPPTAPRVREFQLRQAEVALPWAARELDLPRTLGS